MKNKKVLVCCDTGCLAKNSYEIYEKFCDLLASEDVQVVADVKPTGCHGLCEKGPVVKILPDDISYFKVSKDDVEEIIEKTIKADEIIERLLYYDIVDKIRIENKKDIGFYKHQYKIALRNVGEIDPLNIVDYIERDGYKALGKVLSYENPKKVIEEIIESGLRGRGGAGFPTGIKWKSCGEQKDATKYIICNGDEGEPGAFMDRSIMEGDPNTIIEGMAICGFAVGSSRGFLYIRDEYERARNKMQKSIDNARANGFLGENIMESGFNFDLEIVRGGGAFVCGESSALMESIEGRIGEPQAKFIRSVEKGLWDKPTILNNVETWANVPAIINNGASWFKSMGTENNSGTKVFSLVGKVKNTGLVEVPMGTSLKELVFDIGGGIINNKLFKGVQTGGPSGGCIPKELMNVKLDFDSLNEIGSMMGSGGVIVMDSDTCMVELARYYMEFLAGESCGKCTTCREGIRTMLKILTNITEGKGEMEDIDLLVQLGKTVEKGSLCGLGKTAPNPVLTTIQYFRNEYEEHILEKKCTAGVCRALTSYKIDSDLCIGCGLCKSKCPVDAISGLAKEAHTIDQDKCIKCGECYKSCPVEAIARGGGNLGN
jgi:NADH-quinone oxidoreductase subunit F